MMTAAPAGGGLSRETQTADFDPLENAKAAQARDSHDKEESPNL